MKSGCLDKEKTACWANGEHTLKMTDHEQIQEQIPGWEFALI